ncbi:LPS translocon maturation chaperone LptM [Acidihalobacter prosperus]
MVLIGLRRRLQWFAYALVLSASLSGCGQKGPLYLPPSHQKTATGESSGS